MATRALTAPLIALIACAAVAGSGTVKGKPNHLAGEKSLYLQQHAHNPVDWYPWGEEAFAKARKEDKPIFLSIGYSTCHWCHVMERESFVDETVAKVLNESFVAIKVDREERPDVDQIYMSALHAQGDGGGWPLNVFLTPELKPFHGGTYYPRDTFLRILSAFKDAWKKDRKKVFEVADGLTGAIREMNSAALAGKLDRGALSALALDRWHQFDSMHGGFGRAPKFPPAMTLRAMLREGSKRSLEMVDRTLDGMWRGGMYDHVAGGFHRYSTDQHWLVPHFEKMLYDNALLASVYVEAFQATGKARWKHVGREILEYVLRDMRHPRGAFHAATDADSEGEEGRFFVWTPDELKRVLGDEATDVGRIYGVTATGNFEHGRSILHLPRTLEEWARELKTDLPALEARLDAARKKLYAAREKRPHPARDEKVVTSWAALMTSAFCHGAQALDEPRYRTAAVEAGEFLFRELVHEGRVYRRWIDGHRAHPGTLEDVSYLLNMSIDLWETTFDPVWLERALALVETMDRFRDAKGGGYWLSEPRPDLLVPVKDSHDGAVPSGNGMAVVALARLAELTERKDVRERAERTAEAFAGLVKRTPAGFPNFMLAIGFLVGEPHQVVISGDPKAPETQSLWRVAHAAFLPSRVFAHAGGPHGARAAKLVPLLEGKGGGAPTAYVCRKKVCRKPVTDPAELATQLR